MISRARRQPEATAARNHGHGDRHTTRRRPIAPAALAAAMILPGAALAAQSIPLGTPVGTATDTLTISGVYASPPGAQPFATPTFTLTVTVPQEVSIAYPVASPPDGLFRTPTTGSYSDGGQTETFSTPYLEFGDFTSAGVQATNPASQVTVDIADLLTGSDEFNLMAETALLPIYTFSNNGATATLNTGVYGLYGGSATYTSFSDPTFTGTVTVAASGAVPEPAAWALMIVGIGLSGAGLRRVRIRTAQGRFI